MKSDTNRINYHQTTKVINEYEEDKNNEKEMCENEEIEDLKPENKVQMTDNILNNKEDYDIGDFNSLALLDDNNEVGSLARLEVPKKLCFDKDEEDHIDDTYSTPHFTPNSECPNQKTNTIHTNNEESKKTLMTLKDTIETSSNNPLTYSATLSSIGKASIKSIETGRASEAILNGQHSIESIDKVLGEEMIRKMLFECLSTKDKNESKSLLEPMRLISKNTINKNEKSTESFEPRLDIVDFAIKSYLKNVLIGSNDNIAE